MGFLALAVVGLFAGLLAVAISGGERSPGVLGSLGLGLFGSCLGTLGGALLYGGPLSAELHPSGVVASVLGAALMLVLARGWTARVAA